MQHIVDIDKTQIHKVRHEPTTHGVIREQRHRIEKELRAAGADTYDLLLPESRGLPLIIEEAETILGVVYGRYKMNPKLHGRGILVATKHRLLFLDKKPLFIRCNEIPYVQVSGISYSQVGLGGTVTLNTRMGDITIRTYNHTCATTFVHSIESHIFELH
jgi:hypothetical protein